MRKLLFAASLLAFGVFASAASAEVVVHVSKARQAMYVYVDRRLVYVWPVRRRPGAITHPTASFIPPRSIPTTVLGDMVRPCRTSYSRGDMRSTAPTISGIWATPHLTAASGFILRMPARSTNSSAIPTAPGSLCRVIDWRKQHPGRTEHDTLQLYQTGPSLAPLPSAGLPRLKARIPCRSLQEP